MSKPSESVTDILKEWASIQEQLEKVFRNRDQIGAKEWMNKGIQLYLRFLFLTNGLPLSYNDAIPFESIEYMPVNLEERFAFIKYRPSLYHSYRQLSELMVEQEKQYARKTIQKNKRPT
ncbi:YpoC family protein [Neobacillus sp. 114]|uniref:YpoC family protein n=1 Tax=Neobacillus sp. 114 TaxID=3048535 RepID=UPI0024C356EF|nr:hypothetical protein [Neobacillus sp. 114]